MPKTTKIKKKISKSKPKIAKKSKVAVKLTNCKSLLGLKEFIKDLNDNHNKIKKLYGYTRNNYLPKIFYK